MWADFQWHGHTCNSFKLICWKTCFLYQKKQVMLPYRKMITSFPVLLHITPFSQICFPSSTPAGFWSTSVSLVSRSTRGSSCWYLDLALLSCTFHQKTNVEMLNLFNILNIQHAIPHKIIVFGCVWNSKPLIFFLWMMAVLGYPNVNFQGHLTQEFHFLDRFPRPWTLHATWSCDILHSLC